MSTNFLNTILVSTVNLVKGVTLPIISYVLRRCLKIPGFYSARAEAHGKTVT